MDDAGRQAAWDGSGLFFIVGTGRCGSTLLQSMLTSHSRVVVPAETHFFSKFDPAKVVGGAVTEWNLGAYLDGCEREAYWGDLGIARAELEAAVRGGARDTRALFVWMMERLAEGGIPAGSVVGEKTPHHEKWIDRILGVFPGARFISMYRDPRDVVVSLREMPWRTSDSVLLNARRCRKTYERQARYARGLGGDVFATLRYETLVEDPEGELRRICAFLGIAFEEGMLRYYERRDSGYLGAEESWKGMTRKPIDKSRQGRYREKLTPHEIRTVERTVGRQLGVFGYERDKESPPDRIGWVLADALEFGVWRIKRVIEGVLKRLGLWPSA